MAVLLSILLTMGFAYWYYRTAERVGTKAVHWAVAGALAYQVSAWAWMMLVARPYLLGLRATTARSGTAALLIGHSWIVVGVVVAWLIHRFLLLRTNVRAE